MEAAKTGSRVFHLGVEQLSSGIDSTKNQQDTRQKGPEPDIIFWHDNSHGHVLIRNGAGVVIQGNGAPAVQGSGEPADGISYDNGGIVFNGATTFHGHYFKADERLTSNDNKLPSRFDATASLDYQRLVAERPQCGTTAGRTAKPF